MLNINSVLLIIRKVSIFFCHYINNKNINEIKKSNEAENSNGLAKKEAYLGFAL